MSAPPRDVSAPPRGAPAPDRDDEEELDQRALDLGIIRRLARYTRPYATKRNVLLALVLIRSIQLPVLGWVVGAVLSGPIADHDARGTWLGALGFLALATLTEATFHFRMRLALELGEAVVHDLRNAIYAHLLRHAAGLLPGAHRAGWGGSSAAPSPTWTTSASASRTWRSRRWCTWGRCWARRR